MNPALALCVSCGLLAALAAPAAALDAHILTSAAPTRAAAQAATELSDYLGRMTGTTVPIIRGGGATPAAGTAILVGDSDRARALGFSSEDLAPEQIRVKTGDGWVLVMGADRGPTGRELNGTLWAAYELLERLGVRWLWPGPLGEVVPHAPDLTIPPLDVDFTPPIIQRHIRNIRYNERVQRGLDSLGFTREQFEALYEDGPAWFTRQRLGTQGRFSYGHAFGHWWDTYSRDHPDWFALQPDGTRNQGNIGNRSRLCVSNPEVIARAAEEACERLAADPDLFCASISPNDGGRATFCLCDNCRAWDPPEAELVRVWHPTDRDFMVPSLTDRYVRFYSEVAKIVAERFPDRYLGAYAYSAYRLPPVREKLHPNVFIGFVGLGYLNEEARQRDLATWDAWTQAAERFFLRPNLLMGGMGYPALYPRRLVADLKHCFDTGMRVTDFDCCYQHWALQGLNYYVLARFLWDPEIDVDAVITDYCAAGWGPAAAPIREYFDRLEKLIDRVALEGADQGRRDTPEVLPGYYTDEFLAGCRECLEHARELAAGDETILARIAFLETGLDYTRLNRDRILTRAALRAGTGDRAAAEEAQKALDDYYRRMGITWAVNSAYLRFYGF